MNIPVTSGILGLVLAWGLWLVWVAVRAGGAPSFADRIAPQLRAVELEGGIHTTCLLYTSDAADDVYQV